jgi:SAM-dependent methyltransferase
MMCQSTHDASRELFALRILDRLMVDWNAAQAEEISTWVNSISVSPVRLLGALTSAASLYEFMQSQGVKYHRVAEIGIGPLGLGWTAAFGQGSPDDLVAIDPLPRIEPSTGIAELDELVLRLQRRVTYVQGRAEDRLLPGGSFDLVVCDNVIDHTERPELVLAECRRLIAENGSLVFGVNVFSTVGYQKWVRYSRPRRPQESNAILHPHSYTERTADELVGATGWRVVARQAASPVRRLTGHSYSYRLIARPG